jgi:MFS family permease
LRQAWVALAGLSAVFLFEMLDNSILNVALPTIGRELRASTTALQWVTGAYAVVFGGLMLAFGRLPTGSGGDASCLSGFVLLGLASLATAFVSSAEQLIGVRAAMGVAAAMTTPGSMALAFRLFDEDGPRVRAITLISTVGLVGLAIGPPVGGFTLATAPWQILLLEAYRSSAGAWSIGRAERWLRALGGRCVRRSTSCALSGLGRRSVQERRGCRCSAVRRPA